MGWRSVSVAGATSKYAEDLNLDDGPRLFFANFSYKSTGENGVLPDSVELYLRNLGGEPSESLSFEVRNYGAYRFKFERRRSDYFYDDIIVLPIDASIEGSTGGDFHRFDFERIRDNASLSVQLNEHAAVNLGFERVGKHGNSTTTLDVQRDVFEFDKPIDESLQVYWLGFHYDWTKYSIFVEERTRDYDNQTELFLPGFSVGQNASDLTTLDFLFLNQPYSYRNHEHTLRVSAQPTTRFEVKAAAMISDLDLSAAATERSQGIDFFGNPFAVDTDGAGGIGRDIRYFDVDMALTISDRLQLIGGLRHHNLEQSGKFLANSSEGGSSAWDVEVATYELGMQWVASKSVTLTLGLSNERRDTSVFELPADGATIARASSTDSSGLYGTLSYRPNGRLSLTASIDDTNIDDPFSLASPANSTRHRLRAKYSLENGLTLVASHSRTDRDNQQSNWLTEVRQSDIRIVHQSKKLALSAGASVIDVTRDFERLVTGGSRQDLFSVSYAADTSFLDASARWSINEQWTVGAYYRAYDNDGSFRVTRDDRLGFVERKLPRNYVLRVSHRSVDYDEASIDDYDADIIEATIGFGF